MCIRKYEYTRTHTHTNTYTHLPKVRQEYGICCVALYLCGRFRSEF